MQFILHYNSNKLHHSHINHVIHFPSITSCCYTATATATATIAATAIATANCLLLLPTVYCHRHCHCIQIIRTATTGVYCPSECKTDTNIL